MNQLRYPCPTDRIYSHMSETSVGSFKWLRSLNRVRQALPHVRPNVYDPPSAAAAASQRTVPRGQVPMQVLRSPWQHPHHGGSPAARWRPPSSTDRDPTVRVIPSGLSDAGAGRGRNGDAPRCQTLKQHDVRSDPASLADAHVTQNTCPNPNMHLVAKARSRLSGPP
jgi:hypothetical protein